MNVSRRSFLGGSIILTAALMLPAKELLGRVPIIYGDGVRDDWAGLQAAIDGEPFYALNEAIARDAGGQVIVRHGTFLLTRTLDVRRQACIVGGHFKASDDLDGTVIRLSGEATLVDAYLEGGKRTRLAVDARGDSIASNLFVEGSGAPFLGSCVYHIEG